VTHASLLASQGSPRGCINFEEILQSTGCVAGGTGAAGVLLGLVARLGMQLFSLLWDRNATLPVVDRPLSNYGHKTPVLQPLPGLV